MRRSSSLARSTHTAATALALWSVLCAAHPPSPATSSLPQAFARVVAQASQPSCAASGSSLLSGSPPCLVSLPQPLTASHHPPHPSPPQPLGGRLVSLVFFTDVLCRQSTGSLLHLLCHQYLWADARVSQPSCAPSVSFSNSSLFSFLPCLVPLRSGVRITLTD